MPRDNVSLIQMAKEDYIVLFHIARLKKGAVEPWIIYNDAHTRSI